MLFRSGPVDAFLDGVFVNSEVEAERDNRLPYMYWARRCMVGPARMFSLEASSMKPSGAITCRCSRSASLSASIFRSAPRGLKLPTNMCVPNRLGLLEGYNRTGPFGGTQGRRLGEFLNLLLKI